ncbi:hypothetical protein [Haloarchaeobius sp. HME9146]|uniref:hypothetical protein n=1 Tax=Haloarchaeobius sp. HME9146 TaxID=2978732 RepID=UPI0021BEE48A|nr:hypothetical protein [Haloarchaeobius sp. HME9146]MCT9097711.1 hypothetical protein [Haloarchaeobius sp. HME9146]
MSSEDDDDGGYVHRPGAVGSDGETSDGVVHPDSVEREFDYRGWTLVGVIVFAFLVAPIVVYLRPPALPYWVALLAFPMLPALFLGVMAVWATTRP